MVIRGKNRVSIRRKRWSVQFRVVHGDLARSSQDYRDGNFVLDARTTETRSRIIGACRTGGIRHEETTQRRHRPRNRGERATWVQASFRTLIVKLCRTSQTSWSVRLERLPDRLCLNKFTCRSKAWTATVPFSSFRHRAFFGLRQSQAANSRSEVWSETRV